MRSACSRSSTSLARGASDPGWGRGSVVEISREVQGAGRSALSRESSAADCRFPGLPVRMNVCPKPLGPGKLVMRLDLSRFKAGEQRVDKTYDPAAFPVVAGDEFRVVAPVVLATEVRKDSKKVRLVGTVKTTLECDCSRCLEPFSVPVDSAFDLLYLPAGATVEAAADEEQEIQA